MAILYIPFSSILSQKIHAVTISHSILISDLNISQFIPYLYLGDDGFDGDLPEIHEAFLGKDSLIPRYVKMEEDQGGL